jgi:hypothetical protein
MQMECVDFVSLNQAKEKPLRFSQGLCDSVKTYLARVGRPVLMVGTLLSAALN